MLMFSDNRLRNICDNQSKQTLPTRALNETLFLFENYTEQMLKVPSFFAGNNASFLTKKTRKNCIKDVLIKEG